MQDFIKECIAALRPRYALTHELMVGNYAVVLSGTEVETGMPVAVKALFPETSQGMASVALREYNNMMTLPDHGYIVNFDAVVVLDNFAVCFVMKRYTCTLRHVIRLNKLSIIQKRQLCAQLMLAIKHVHAHDMSHRDIKPDNVFVDTELGHVVLGDFGMARTQMSMRCNGVDYNGLTGTVVTVFYSPPETLVETFAYTESVDIWSCGILFSELLSGLLPFREVKEREKYLQELLYTHGTPPPGTVARSFLETIDEKCDTRLDFGSMHASSYLPIHLSEHEPTVSDADLDMVMRMLQYVPIERPDAAAVLDSIEYNPDVMTIGFSGDYFYSGKPIVMPADGSESSLIVEVGISTVQYNGMSASFANTVNFWHCVSKSNLEFLKQLAQHVYDTSVQHFWAIEAWLMAMVLSHWRCAYEETPTTLAAMVTYCLAVAQFGDAPETYNRFDWLKNVRGIRIKDVMRAEIDIVLSLHGFAPLAPLKLWKRAKHQCTSPLRALQFIVSTLYEKI